MRSKNNLPKATFESAWKIVQENAKAIKQMQEEEKIARKEMRKSLKTMQKELGGISNSNKESIKALQKELGGISNSNKESIKALQKELGGISKSNGEVAESYFINSFDKSMKFAGQKYDAIALNLRKKISEINLQGEYDLVLYNCTSVVIIEIKYKARKEDVEELLNKAPVFKQLFPEYANYDLYLGLAGLHVNVTAEKEAIKKGIAIIKQVGNNMVINDDHLKVF